jgi:DNA topoisomerase IB
VLEAVATQLGHTPAICRSSYIHPQLLDDYAAGRLGELATRVPRVAHGAACLDVDVLRRIEPAVAAYLARCARLSAPGRCATGRSGRRPSRPRSRAR